MERLEGREPASLWWDPFPAIDVLDVNWDSGNGEFYVKGDTATFSINGTGEDWDTWHEDGVEGPGGMEEEQVTITWDGGSLGTRTGTEVSFQFTDVGVYTFVMTADDAGAIPERDDAAVVFSSTKTAFWVAIHGSFDGPFDVPDNGLRLDHPQLTAKSHII